MPESFPTPSGMLLKNHSSVCSFQTLPIELVLDYRSLGSIRFLLVGRASIHIITIFWMCPLLIIILLYHIMLFA